MESSTATKPKPTTLKAPSTPGLLERLHRAQKAAQPVAKQGKNTAQGYDYARAEDVISEASKVLQAEGLVALMEFSEIEEQPITSKGGGSGLYVRVQATLRIVNPDDNDTMFIRGYGTGIDYPGDKAVFKAQTGGAKYAYASALALPFTDDPEHDRGVPADAGGAPAVSPKQLDFFASLVKKTAPAQADQLMVDRVTLWGAAELTGGRGGSMSKAIDGLKEKPEETWRRLQTKAMEWTPPPDGPDPDLSDLPPADPEGEQSTIL